VATGMNSTYRTRQRGPVSTMAILCLMSAIFLGPFIMGADLGTVVAVTDVQMETHTRLFKLPVEAHRGEEWLLLRKGKYKVILTFGPNDERRANMVSIRPDWMPEYEIERKRFDSAFVVSPDWPIVRRRLAADLKRQRFADLSIEDCERLVSGGVWVGLTRDQASEAIGKRIISKEIQETKDGKSEVWRLGAVSISTMAESTAMHHVYEDVLFSTPSRHLEPFDVKAERDAEQNTRLILIFKGDTLVSITRR